MAAERRDNATPESNRTVRERLCEAFERQWQEAAQRAGERPRVEDYLAQIPESERSGLIQELLLLDQEYRSRVGDPSSVSEYQQRFPDYARLIGIVLGQASGVGLARERIGNYRVLKVLGRGGMGIVYKVKHEQLGRVRALKLLAGHLVDNHEAVERFRAEVENTGRLDHPNIVQAIDAGEISGEYFLVMDFVDGWNLGQLVEEYRQRQELVPMGVACELIRQAASGLQHAHEHLLVHRDIKPSNLMLNRKGEVKILDLGLARFVAEQEPRTRLTLPFGGMGTPDYMAPEQGEDASTADIRADIYSLGCTLYYLLTGNVPYGGEQYKSLWRKQLAHRESPIPSLRDDRPDAPPELQDILERMMAKRPEDRYAEPGQVVAVLSPLSDAGQLQAMVTLLEQSQPSSSPSPGKSSGPLSSGTAPPSRTVPRPPSSRPFRPSPWSLARIWRRSRRWMIVAVPVAVVAILVGIWVYRSLFQASPDDPEADRLGVELALLPGLNGKWWFDEMPWLTPAVRQAIDEAIHTRGSQAALGGKPDEYLNPNVLAVQQWLLTLVDGCRDSLSEKQAMLLDRLIALSKDNLLDEDLRKELEAAYLRFVEGRQELKGWNGADLYTRALLEHKLALLKDDSGLAKQSQQAYKAAWAALQSGDGSAQRLAPLCRADSARLCASALKDYKEADQQFAEALARENLSVFFRVTTLVARGEASSASSKYQDAITSMRFEDAKTYFDASGNGASAARKISGNHPLRACVSERYAWSLMDQWRVEEAFEQFDDAVKIRWANLRESDNRNKFAWIYVFHNRHGIAMTKRYRGSIAEARTDYDSLLADIEEKLKEEQAAGESWPGQQRYLRDLRERLSNSNERRADCELYQGLDGGSQLKVAAKFYKAAYDTGEDSRLRLAFACKRCIAMALSGNVETARQELNDEKVSKREVIGEDSERAEYLRRLAYAVLALKENHSGAKQDQLRAFLGSLQGMPDNGRRETLEMQLLGAELLLRSDLESKANAATASDTSFLSRLLQPLRSNAALLPFLRRHYDLLIEAMGDENPDRTARYIQILHGPEQQRTPAAATLSFHLREDKGICVVQPPLTEAQPFRSKCFALPFGRQQVKKAVPGKLAPELLELVRKWRDEKREVEVLWSDSASWPPGQQERALSVDDFPFKDELKFAKLK